MASQAVRQTYTYYSPERPEGRTIEDAPLAGRGEAWTLGAYKHPVYPSPLNARVGDAGIKVWIVIGRLRAAGDDGQRVLRHYGDVLRTEDLDAATWYYQQNQQAIDERLAEEVGAA